MLAGLTYQKRKKTATPLKTVKLSIEVIFVTGNICNVVSKLTITHTYNTFTVLCECVCACMSLAYNATVLPFTGLFK